jgi:hypothetical protein
MLFSRRVQARRGQIPRDVDAEQLERQMPEQIEARQTELAAVGTLRRDISDPKARRFLDHFQQNSRYKLSRQRPIVDGLLDRHGDVFAEQPVLTATIV